MLIYCKYYDVLSCNMHMAFVNCDSFPPVCQMSIVRINPSRIEVMSQSREFVIGQLRSNPGEQVQTIDR
jgi:hypothetical protein